MLEHDVREHRHIDRKQHKPFQGRKITQQLPCHPHPPRYKPKHQPHHKQSLEVDTFRTLLSKRDRHKESQSKLELKPHRRVQCQPREERATLKKQASKSRSRSKGLSKSKSVKMLVKKSKSMARLEPRREGHREERKSQSPPYHTKSTTSHQNKRPCKSHYNSKTTRQMVSQLTTERDRHKPKHPKSIKKPKSDLTKKNLNKTRKKSEKENIKLQPKSKPKRNMKKNKQVLISEQHSKVRREGEEWQSSMNEDQFLNPKQHKSRSKNKRSNIVEIPKRKERLSLNANHPRKQVLKNKTQMEHEHYQSVKHELQNHAATVIQKVFRGYLTRKYIKQCFQHNAAIKIQKVWRGYMARRKLIMKSQRQRLNISSQRQNMYPSPQKHSANKILEHQDYLLRGSASDVKSSGGNMNYASILEEILSQESVSITMKKKIEFFLQKSQQQSFQDFDPLQDVRSPSARSSISSQLINNQIDSQRKFIQKMKKQKPKDPHIFLSPKQYSPGNLQPNLKDQFCSPQHRLSQSPPRSSTQLLIANLKNIQKIHRVRFQSRATHEKEQLNRMLIKNKLSPRTHEKKYKEVDLLLESQLEKFNESINQIVKNCIAYGQEEDQEDQDAMITPKKQLTQLQLPGSGDVSPHHQPIRGGEEMSVEFREYYQQQKETAEKEAEFEPFDTSYQFIQEYLISLIDYVRQYDGGGWVAKVLESLHKSKSHEMDVIIRNSKLITENSEDEQEHSFRLPMYKYIDLQEPIVEDQIIQEFNNYFPKLQGQQLGAPSTIQECFLKMIVESMNEALNALRPQSYPFVESKLSSVNMLKGLEKIPFECESSQEQMHYQFVCAQALNKIFYWNRLEWGRVIRLSESQQNYAQNKLLLEKELETSIVQIYAQQQWHNYEELVEIIGSLGQQTFEEVILEEIAAIWGMVMEWNMKMGRMPIYIQAPDNKEYYLP